MVQPNFSSSKKGDEDGSEAFSATAALDVFLDNQHQSYFEELYKSEAVCLCVLRCVPCLFRFVSVLTLFVDCYLPSAAISSYTTYGHTMESE